MNPLLGTSTILSWSVTRALGRPAPLFLIQPWSVLRGRGSGTPTKAKDCILDLWTYSNHRDHPRNKFMYILPSKSAHTLHTLCRELYVFSLSHSIPGTKLPVRKPRLINWASYDRYNRPKGSPIPVLGFRDVAPKTYEQSYNSETAVTCETHPSTWDEFPLGYSYVEYSTYMY